MSTIAGARKEVQSSLSFPVVQRHVAFASLSLFLAACAITEPTPPPPPPAKADPPRSETKLPTERTKKQPPVLALKRPTAIPTRALNVTAQCSFKDETGYNGNMRLSVQDAKVQAFDAAVNIPGRGTCRFDLKSFRQTRELPNVELSHLREPCIVRVWEQEERVTVAFQQCQKMCSGKAWDHLWPILADRRDGSCA
jgi:hypothetical protein